MGHLAARSGLKTYVAVPLRLGCISHALMTVDYLRARGCALRGFVLIERWLDPGGADRDDVQRALSKELPVLVTLPHDRSPQAVANAAALLNNETACLRLEC